MKKISYRKHLDTLFVNTIMLILFHFNVHVCS